jgi:hypothetical protein
MFDCEHLSAIPAVRCSLEHIFVSYQRVADNYPQCPKSYDDELAQYMSPTCHICECQGFSVFCNSTTTYPNISKWTKSLIVHGYRGQTLDFASNVAGSFCEAMQNLDFLLLLEIAHSKLAFIANSTFVSLTHLTVLHLTDNSLTNIAHGTFTYLTHLHELSLSGNPLLTLAPLGSLSVQLMDLSHTQLSSMEGVIPTENHITELRLQGNRLASVYLEQYQNLHAIK